MFSKIKALNAEYDHMDEPGRFLMFFLLVLAIIILCNIVPYIGWPLLIAAAAFRFIGKFNC